MCVVRCCVCVCVHVECVVMWWKWWWCTCCVCGVSNKHAVGVRTVASESCDRTRRLGRGLCAKGHDSWRWRQLGAFLKEVCTGHSLDSTHMTIVMDVEQISSTTFTTSLFWFSPIVCTTDCVWKLAMMVRQCSECQGGEFSSKRLQLVTMTLLR